MDGGGAKKIKIYIIKKPFLSTQLTSAWLSMMDFIFLSTQL